MQHSSPAATENASMLPAAASARSDGALLKKLAMFENSSATGPTTDDPSNAPVSLIKPASTTLSINENEPVKSSGRRRKPLRPWSLSARGERPNSTVAANADCIEPISDNDDQSETKPSPVNTAMLNSNLNDDSSNYEWPKQLCTIEEILKMYRVETNGSVECIRCGCKANQDNLLEHVSVHYPYKCYACGFYCNSSSSLDEHNRTHTISDVQSISPLADEQPLPLTTSTRSSEPANGACSEKTTPSSKAKVHRCRQCSFVSSVKEDYWAHHRVHIRADKVLECPSCPFVTEYKHHLEYHLRNHLGSKPFKCSKCDYACVNLSMLRSHKKSHFRHLLFRCATCSFESKQYPALQEHLQNENHEPYLDENIEEFLKEYAHGNLASLSNTTHLSSSTPPTLVSAPATKTSTRQPRAKKRKVAAKRTSSVSSEESSADMLSTEEPQTDAASIPLACSLCDYVAVSKEGLGVHLFQHACQKTDPLHRSLLTNAALDPAAKLFELFNGKLGSFMNTAGASTQLNDFLAPYQQFLTQQMQSHFSSTNIHNYQLDNNNNHAPPPSVLHGSYSLLSSCLRADSHDHSVPPAKRQRKEPLADDEHDERNSNFVDQQTQVDEWQIKRLFECFHCEMIFKDFAMYCTHKQFHYSPDNPFRCAQCGEQSTNKYDFFVHVTQQAHDLS